MRRSLACLLLCLSCRAALPAGGGDVPRASPASLGVDPAGVLAFVEALSAADKQEPHSLMVLRHGRVVAEGWWAPYRADLNHGLYSLSKSFTSTAIGFAVAEGRLSVEDKVASFFPDALPSPVPPLLAALRVRDLLTMSTGQAREPTWEMVRQDDWVRHFLSAAVDREPGTVFQYNSGATYMLSAIVQQRTGQTVRDYLEGKLFQPLGITGATWDTCPRGRSVGGWGLSLTTEALARFGQFLLQKGEWNGVRLLPAAWVEEATTAHIQQHRPEKPGRPHEANDWVQGYGYQFWRCTHGAVRGDGAFGQYLVMLPAQDAVIAITGNSANLQGVLDLVWKHLLPAFREGTLPEDPAATAALRDRLAGLALPLPPAGTAAPAAAGGTYALATNSLDLVSARLDLGPGGGALRFTDAGDAYDIPFAFGRWAEGRTDLPGTPPSLVFRAARKPARAMPVATAARWLDPSNLELTVRYLETPHFDRITCRLDGDALEIRFRNSVGPDEKRPALRGRKTP